MIDINKLRVDKGGNPEIYRKSEIARGRDGSLVNAVIELDKTWVKAEFQVSELRRELNQISKEIAVLRKQKHDATDFIIKSTELKGLMTAKAAEANNFLQQRNHNLSLIGNLVHESVPNFVDEKHNPVVRTFGTIQEKNFSVLPYYTIMEKLNFVEMNKSSLIVGHRAYYLLGLGARLNQALFSYAQNFLQQYNYTLVQVPMFIKKSYMQKAAELQDFEESLYIINNSNDGNEDLCLIATSEQPLCCLHADQTFQRTELPVKYCGISSCFRKEAGSHGKDMRGIFRVHQFEKIEQFVITSPSSSADMLEQMIEISEKFYQSLELPYQVISIVSGGLNNAASKKYDLEAWFPATKEFRELVSCSNCTDYQSRDLNIRYGQVDSNQGEKQFVHLLNGTLCATERTLCCILENYQDEKGIRIPKVLQPYLSNLEYIPYE